MASGKEVADLDMRRIKKHMDAGRWECVPEHLCPLDELQAACLGLLLSSRPGFVS